VRDYTPVMDQYRIPREAVRELIHFCRQYDWKKREAKYLLTISSPDMSGMPKGNSVGRPVESTVLKRQRFLDDVDLIDKAATETDSGKWTAVLIESCCRQVPWHQLDQTQLPSSNRSDFFKARREFFWRLYEMKIGTLGAMDQ